MVYGSAYMDTVCSRQMVTQTKAQTVDERSH
ncbi:hypothetical protein GALL_303210 [mine drainage metagenome]|uniref:Uncharacterized protein n=1 Tax=mine drainage metagenome TaxID=410659 RepID=A0A1J5QVY9_9ZZZZ